MNLRFTHDRLVLARPAHAAGMAPLKLLYATWSSLMEPWMGPLRPGSGPLSWLPCRWMAESEVKFEKPAALHAKRRNHLSPLHHV